MSCEIQAWAGFLAGLAGTVAVILYLWWKAEGRL